MENQRVRTARVYLNDNWSGGETELLKASLKVRGQRGDAIVFQNAAADGRADPMLEYAGLPVVNGLRI